MGGWSISCRIPAPTPIEGAGPLQREEGSDVPRLGKGEGRREEGRRRRRKERDEGAGGGRARSTGSDPKVGFLEMNQALGGRSSVRDPPANGLNLSVSFLLPRPLRRAPPPTILGEPSHPLALTPGGPGARASSTQAWPAGQGRPAPPPSTGQGVASEWPLLLTVPWCGGRVEDAPWPAAPRLLSAATTCPGRECVEARPGPQKCLFCLSSPKSNVGFLFSH